MAARLVHTERTMSRDRATYVYCAVRAARRPPVRRGLRGLPGADAPRPLEAGEDVWLVVSTVGLEQYGARPIEQGLRDLDWVSRCAMAHEAVVEDAARSGPVVPMKLFTLFSSDARAVGHLARDRKRLARLFERVAGREEWGVRVTLDEREAARRRVARATPSRVTSGTGFLLRKKAERDDRRVAVEDAIRAGNRIYDDLAALAIETRRSTPVQSSTAIRVVLDAAFLVPAKEARRFRSAVARQAAAHRDLGCDVTLTGPWPPYHFVSESA
jgi:hypothetical protein